MRYVLLTFVWLIHGFATDSTGLDAACSLIGWLCSLGIVEGWRRHDREAWAEVLEDAKALESDVEDLESENADQGARIEQMERENADLRTKLQRHEKAHFEKLLEKSHRKTL